MNRPQGHSPAGRITSMKNSNDITRVFWEEKNLVTLPGFEYPFVQRVVLSVYWLHYPGCALKCNKSTKLGRGLYLTHMTVHWLSRTTHCKCKYILSSQMYCIVSKYLLVCNQPHGTIITERLKINQLVKKFLAFYETWISLISELPTNFTHASSSSSIRMVNGKMTVFLIM